MGEQQPEDIKRFVRNIGSSFPTPKQAIKGSLTYPLGYPNRLPILLKSIGKDGK